MKVTKKTIKKELENDRQHFQDRLDLTQKANHMEKYGWLSVRDYIDSFLEHIKELESK